MAVYDWSTPLCTANFGLMGLPSGCNNVWRMSACFLMKRNSSPHQSHVSFVPSYFGTVFLFLPQALHPSTSLPLSSACLGWAQGGWSGCSTSSSWPWWSNESSVRDMPDCFQGTGRSWGKIMILPCGGSFAKGFSMGIPSRWKKRCTPKWLSSPYHQEDLPSENPSQPASTCHLRLQHSQIMPTCVYGISSSLSSSGFRQLLFGKIESGVCPMQLLPGRVKGWQARSNWRTGLKFSCCPRLQNYIELSKSHQLMYDWQVLYDAGIALVDKATYILRDLEQWYISA